MVSTEKLAAKSIEIKRAEGPTKECFAVLIMAEGTEKPVGCTPKHTHVVPADKVWQTANSTLRAWAYSAPEDGYDKCDFSITFADGEIYEGRYDLVHWSKKMADLSLHVKNFVEFGAGVKKPEHLTDRQYRTIQNRTPGLAEQCRLWLEKYQLG